MEELKSIKTLGELKSSGYKSKSIKDELRDNLLLNLRKGISSFEGIFGFDNTVIPDIERAILSRHNILLLGLRGQAKTKLARLMITLMDEYIPAIKDSEINEDPFNPILNETIKMVESKGDALEIRWIHKSERYVEKLATPDVNIADLIGDVDPIKAASLKLSYSDEKVIHYGLIPRAHRSVFVINELPDLQARIQVALFNILQEGDVQIRGFKMRLPLDIQFIFTANPEDYTNRGSIITPLKDRIESQILTHYPTEIAQSKQITIAQSRLHEDQKSAIMIHDIHHDILENLIQIARDSEYVDAKSGVSARVAISAYEILASSAERRMILNNEEKTTTRIGDFWGIIPAITGKLELVYEGEQEGQYNVAVKLLNEAIRTVFLQYFTHPDKYDKRRGKDPYGVIKAYFSGGNICNLMMGTSEKEFKEELMKIAGLSNIVQEKLNNEDDLLIYMELLLHGLAEFQILGKSLIQDGLEFSDPLGDLMNEDMNDDDEV